MFGFVWDLIWRCGGDDVHQVGLSLAFVIYESANPHMGKPFSTYRQTWMLGSTVMRQITN
jgi:hypothetical protein